MSGALMIFGSPRSGTTWIGSLFDAHPRTIYLHEPDVVVREPRMPFIPQGDLPGDIDRIAQDYFERLSANRSLRTVFVPTIFPKAYRTAPMDVLRTGIILALRAVDAVLPMVGRSTSLQVPDLTRDADHPYLVMKSVDSVTRLPIFARALPGVKFIHLIRHPCGVAASKLRGIALGRMNPPPMYRSMLSLPPGRAAGLDETRVAGMNNAEKLAWEWLITNDWVIGEVAGLPNVRTVIYDHVAESPESEVASLFDWAELDVDPQVVDYLRRLSGIAGTGDRYFSLNQNPSKSANKWREEICADDRDTIERVVTGTGAGALFGY